jgi:hypothetical protein
METESFESPKELNTTSVIKWSNTYKALEILDQENKWKTYSIRAKAKKFLKNKCIEYSKEKKCYLCKPLKGYNTSTYELKSLPNQEFECNCQFYQRVVKKQEIPGLICSHILALKLMLKIWNWERRRKSKELDGFK